MLDGDDDDDEPVLHLLTDANSPHKDRLADRHLKPTPNIQKRCHLANEKDTENNRACVTRSSVIQCNTYWVQPQLSIALLLCQHQTNGCACCKAQKRNRLSCEWSSSIVHTSMRVKQGVPFRCLISQSKLTTAI